MRASIPIALVFLALGCGDEDTRPPARLSPEPAHATTTPATPQPTVEHPAPPVVEQQPTVETPPAVDPERPIPTSPPLPTPPSDPTRAHVFAVSHDEDQDFGDEHDLSREDASKDARLFIPAAALRPADDELIPVPNGDDRSLYLEVKFPRFHYPDARVERLVNERVRSFARALSTSSGPEIECEGIATLQFVSIRCSIGATTARSPRAAENVGYSTLTLKIERGEVRPMSVADAFVPGSELVSILARGCERFVDEQGGHGGTFFDCRARPELLEQATFAPEGIEVSVDDNVTEMGLEGTFVVPYDDLAGNLLARGPLAQALYRRRARTREIQIDPSRRAPAPPSRTMWAVTPMLSPAEAAQHWLRLPAAQRGAVQFLDGYLTAPSPDAARAAATALGFSAREVSVSTTATPLALRALQLTRDSPLRVDARRTAPVARALLRGTFIVAAAGAIEGHVRAFAAADADGYVDARATGPADACMPDLGPVLASLPGNARAGAAVSTLRALTRQAGGGRAIFATELGRTIHVEIRRVSDACVADQVIARFDRPGARLTYIGLTHSERRAGTALIVTLDDSGPPPHDDEGEPRGNGRPAQLAVYAYEGGRSVYSGPLGQGERVANGRSEGDVWYPIAVLDAEGEPAGGFRWTGQTLTRAAPP